MSEVRTLPRGKLSNVSVILTRWVMVIAISYAIIFSADGTVPGQAVPSAG